MLELIYKIILVSETEKSLKHPSVFPALGKVAAVTGEGEEEGEKAVPHRLSGAPAYLKVRELWAGLWRRRRAFTEGGRAVPCWRGSGSREGRREGLAEVLRGLLTPSLVATVLMANSAFRIALSGSNMMRTTYVILSFLVATLKSKKMKFFSNTLRVTPYI